MPRVAGSRFEQVGLESGSDASWFCDLMLVAFEPLFPYE